MRFSNMILGLFSVAVVGSASLVGCGSDGGNTGGGGGTAPTTSSGTTTSSGGSCTAACCLGASCKAADKECVGLVDNKDQTKFGLRMSELTISKPAALASGLVAGIVAGAVTPSNAGCNLNGSATFNWLLQFDTTASTLKTGGAKPVTDATAGYDFVQETVGGKDIAPITFDGVAPDASGAFAVSAGKDLLVPIYLDATGTQVVILPLKQAKLSMATLSASKNCIGSYNAQNLDPTNSCLPDAQNHAFLTGATLDGYVTLDDADSVVIASLSQSLCVVLSQDAATYGEKDANNITVCKRTGGVINFKGDTCSTAGGSCTDSVSLAAKFAASSVKINN
ncbi:Hypothetical protein A7982_02476 [Minicystis rosea]|nr:Hypothetical protein A7982_02476 [Minicystis rosea]